MVLVTSQKLIGLFLKDMICHEFSEIIELFDILIFVPKFNLLVIVRQEFIKDFLVDNVLTGLISELVV